MVEKASSEYKKKYMMHYKYMYLNNPSAMSRM